MLNEKYIFSYEKIVPLASIIMSKIALYYGMEYASTTQGTAANLAIVSHRYNG
jgi:hypothetical protein